jgi:signal transduction histidine kinase
MDTRMLRFATMALFIASCSAGPSKDVLKPTIRPKDNPLSAVDSAEIRKLSEKAREVQFSQPDSAIYFCLKKREIEERAGNKQKVMDYYVEVNTIHINNRSDPKQGKIYADSALWFAEQKGNEWLKYKAYKCLGYCYFNVNDSLASYYLLKSLKLQPTPIDSLIFVNTHILLASIARGQGNYDDAMDFYEPVIHYFEKQPPSTFQIITFSNGYSFAEKSTRKERRAMAGQYLFKAKQIADSIKDTLTADLIYYNLATYYARAKEFNLPYKEDSALFFAEKAMEHARPVSQFGDAASPFLGAATIYLNKGDVTKARRIMDRMEALTDSIVFENKQFEADYLHVKYELLKQEGNMAGALAALEKKSKVEEKINKIKKDEQLLNYRKELKKLAAEKLIATKNSLIERQRLQTIGLIVFSIFLALLIAVLYLYWSNKRKLERERLLDIQRQKEFENQKKLFEERSRIADEMHDDLGSTLTSTIMAVELIQQQPENPTHITMISRSAHQLSHQINEIIWNMNVKNDNLESLNDYIFRFAASFLKDANIHFFPNETLNEQNVLVTGQQRRVIYLCTKELINNIVKHAHATKVQMDIVYEKGVLTIDIIDNGVGLLGSKPSTAGSGNGLLNIRKRIDGLNGKVEWNTANPGTHVHLVVPL